MKAAKRYNYHRYLCSINVAKERKREKENNRENLATATEKSILAVSYPE